MLWGLWVASPFWDVFSQAELYEKLYWVQDYGILPEYFWGGIAVACGAVIWRGAVKRNYKSLIRGALVAFFHWLMIATFYFWGDWHNTGGITSLTFSAYALYIYLNLKVNHEKGETDYYT